MARTPVQVPGAPADPVVEEQQQEQAAAPAAFDPRDAEIAALRAQLAAQSAPSAPLVTEGDGPNTRRYKAESKHLHLTSKELHAKVRAGEVTLTDHHVLCSDGWYANPAWNAVHNG